MRSMVEGPRRRRRRVLNSTVGLDRCSDFSRQWRRCPSVTLRVTAPRERGAPSECSYSGNSPSRLPTIWSRPRLDRIFSDMKVWNGSGETV